MKAPTKVKEKYLRLRRNGWSQAQACAEAGVSRSTGHRWDMDLAPDEASLKDALRAKEIPDPIPYGDLGPDARRGLEDFSFFGEHYLARRPVPWRQVVADRLVEMLRDPDETYAVLNEPPGVGKTTLVLDLAVWSICRDRTIRILLGAEILDRAREYLGLVSRILESTRPWYDHRANVEAAGTLSVDFGRFRLTGGPWTQDSITVEQIGGADLSNKEPTATVASRSHGFLGGRYDVCLWDDLVTLRNYHDPGLFEWWRQEAETRLEPGGALVLLGQRVKDDDLFGYCAGRTFTEDDGEKHTEYAHIVFPAHRDDSCDGEHRQWDGDDGCLLDAERLPARKLAARRADPNFAVTFQQDVDAAADGGLVPEVHIFGGIDETGYEAPGSLDRDRQFGEWPDGVDALIDYATVDPAVSTGWWAIEHWGVEPKTRTSYLIFGWRLKMDAGQFLDVRQIGAGTTALSGFMVDVQRESHHAGRPIRAWVIAANRADFLALRAYRMFLDEFPGTVVIAPHTQKNKADEFVGVEALLAPRYRAGQKRLPWQGVDARNYVQRKVRELIRYPHLKEFDTVMSDWFGEAHLDAILAAGSKPAPALHLSKLAPYLEKQRRIIPIDRGEREEVPKGYEPIPAGDPRRERESYIPSLPGGRR